MGELGDLLGFDLGAWERLGNDWLVSGDLPLSGGFLHWLVEVELLGNLFVLDWPLRAVLLLYRKVTRLTIFLFCPLLLCPFPLSYFPFYCP